MSQLKPLKPTNPHPVDPVMLTDALALGFLVEQQGGQVVIPLEELERIMIAYPSGLKTKLVGSEDTKKFCIISINTDGERVQ